MFAQLFFYKNKFKPLAFGNASLYDKSKEELNDIIKISEQLRLKYLKKLDEKFRSSLMILGIVICTIAICHIPVFDSTILFLKDNLSILLEKYNLWWKALPNIIAVFFPSKIIYWSFSLTKIILLVIIILSLRVMLPIFQYRNRQNIKDDFIKIIFHNFTDKYTIESDPNIFKTSDFYKIFDLPSYDGTKIFSPSVIGEFKNHQFKFAEMSFYLNDKIANFRPKINVLSSAIMSIEADFSKDDFLILINPSENYNSNSQYFNKVENLSIKENNIEFYQKDSAYNIDQIKNIVTLIIDYIFQIQNNNIFQEQKFFDDKIANFLARRSKEEFSSIIKMFQFGFFKNQLYIFIPCNREIFGKKSIFTKSIAKEDLEFLISYLELSFKIIELLKII